MTRDEQRKAAIEWLRSHMLRHNMAAWMYRFEADYNSGSWSVTATNADWTRVRCLRVEFDDAGQVSKHDAVELL